MADTVYKKRRRFAPPFFRYPRKTAHSCSRSPRAWTCFGALDTAFVVVEEDLRGGIVCSFGS